VGAAAMTWLVVIPIWFAVSIVVGLLVGKFIRFGGGEEGRPFD
jgi:hypothetical protein